ncbi:hypothetical protein [Bremerella sp. P1]|uniref:hypothetical protein n=1 Tax=Bremerella sp. P1 TaxID=3026424 RepID=UPI002367F3D5|nr:hypothetical protein [Bremerella sp. P1]WDI42234.1 hypothetical protein PSR63_27665 [Bremerella sp. P1]
MNTPQPSPDHAELAVTGMGISLLVAMISGPLAIFAPWRTAFLASCIAMFVFLWAVTMLIAQYMASIRRDVFASKIICLQWGSLATCASIALMWYAGRTISRHGLDVSELGFTSIGLVALVIATLIFTVGNWRWRQRLLEASKQGMTTTPWSQLTIVDIMAATLVTAIVLGTFSFLFRQ